MNWTELDWAALDRLREKFLHGGAAAGPYWESDSYLAAYDATYGERIGWKWDHVLRELRMRGWRPTARTIVDWGCGSGIAARRVIRWLGPDTVDTLTVWDHSPLACDFAARRAEAEFAGLRVSQATPSFFSGDDAIGVLVVSHVLNELSADARNALERLMARADAVLWVEPGTHAVSRQLGAIRASQRSHFEVIAPCTHALDCPIFAAGNERHWCHFFAPSPGEIFANPDWVKFGQRAGIDLRSLPYCFLALERRGAVASSGDPGLSRIIGRPEHFKPYARLLNCDASGLAELTVPKRTAPGLYKELDRAKWPLVYRWEREGAQVTGGTCLK
jgi:hypothetical protein